MGDGMSRPSVRFLTVNPACTFILCVYGVGRDITELKNHELSSWSPVPYNIAISCITYISYIAKSNINYNLQPATCNLQFAICNFEMKMKISTCNKNPTFWRNPNLLLQLERSSKLDVCVPNSVIIIKTSQQCQNDQVSKFETKIISHTEMFCHICIFELCWLPTFVV